MFRFPVLFREFAKLIQIIGAMYGLLFWPWLVLHKGWFNFSKEALVVVLGWPATSNTSFIYGRLVLLQKSNGIELTICSTGHWRADNYFFFEFILPYMSPIIQIQKKNVCIYFGVFVILALIFGVPSWTSIIEKGLYKRVTKQSPKRQRQEPIFSIWKSESAVNFACYFQSHWLSTKSFI